MNLIKIIPQAILCFIAFLAIIIRLGWKHLNKCIPLLSCSNKWTKNCLLLGEIIALVALSYVINVWFWTDSTETGSDFWKMSNPVRAFEQQVSIAKQTISRKPFAFFNETINSLPDGIEEIQAMIDFATTLDVSKLTAFRKWLERKECSNADMSKLLRAKEFQASTNLILKDSNTLKSFKIWEDLKNKMKNEPAEFEIESKLFKKYSESRINFLENIAQHFKQSENGYRKGMLETTENENQKIKKGYLIPSAIIFLFSLHSIYTTIFNPKFQLSQVGRIIFTVLFYALTIQVIILLIYELSNDSSVCHLNPEKFRPYNFKADYKNGTSTENVFTNCISARKSIFSSPTDKVFMPESTYIGVIQNRFLINTKQLIIVVKRPVNQNVEHKKYLDSVLKNMNGVKSTCIGINVHIDGLNEFIDNYLMFFVEEKKKFVNNLIIAEKIINDKFKNFSEVINDPILKANQLINATSFDCYTMFNAYKHGYNRSCFVINSEIIPILKMVITLCSVVCAVIHLLNLKKVALETQISIAIETLSSQELSFNESMNALPEAIEDIQFMIDAAKKVDMSELEEFRLWMQKKGCDESEMNNLREKTRQLKFLMEDVERFVGFLETTNIWQQLREKTKRESNEFENEKNLFKSYSQSRTKFLEKILNVFLNSQNLFRNKMLEYTVHENDNVKKAYLGPAVIVLLFSSFSMYTTIINPQFQLSTVGRVILSVLFYAVSIQTIVIIIFELNTGSIDCHLNPEQFRFYDVDATLNENMDSKSVLSNCISTRTSIFSSPNDEIFMPESVYFKHLKEQFVKETIREVNELIGFRESFEGFMKRFCAYLKPMSDMEGTCKQIKTHMEAIKTFNASNLIIYTEYDIHTMTTAPKAETFVDYKIKNFSEVFHKPILKANQSINATSFDCYAMFHAYQHGYNRSCFLINAEIIPVFKTAVVASSVVCAVIHLLNLKKVEVSIEQPLHPDQHSSSNV